MALELAYTCRDYAQILVRNGKPEDSDKARACCHEAWGIAQRAGAATEVWVEFKRPPQTVFETIQRQKMPSLAKSHGCPPFVNGNKEHRR